MIYIWRFISDLLLPLLHFLHNRLKTLIWPALLSMQFLSDKLLDFLCWKLFLELWRLLIHYHSFTHCEVSLMDWNLLFEGAIYWPVLGFLLAPQFWENISIWVKLINVHILTLQWVFNLLLLRFLFFHQVFVFWKSSCFYLV